jgi:hypothetical protein
LWSSRLLARVSLMHGIVAHLDPAYRAFVCQSLSSLMGIRDRGAVRLQAGEDIQLKR